LRSQDWSAVSMRLLFVLFSMIVMAFVMVFEWDALFPDRRDYQILNPIPIPLHTLFLAKAIALALFLGMFLLDVNFFSTLPRRFRAFSSPYRAAASTALFRWSCRRSS
jgi:hypothetical protein